LCRAFALADHLVELIAAFVSAVALYWLLCRVVEILVAWVERRSEAMR
jgi:ABC-type amino acid transport system permease subunit